jgi:hypothetical protein
MPDRTRKPRTVSELYAAHETLAEQAKALYDQKDATLKKLVGAWKKNKGMKVTDTQVLEIEDTWRGKMKAFAPAFSHRYKLTLRTAPEPKISA